MVIESLCYLVKEVTPDLEKKALILGWCVEWVSDCCTVMYGTVKHVTACGSIPWEYGCLSTNYYGQRSLMS